MVCGNVGHLKQLKHVLMDCRNFSWERTEMFGELMRVGEHVVSLRV